MEKCLVKLKRTLAIVLTFVMIVSIITVSSSTTVEAAAKKVVKSLSGFLLVRHLMSVIQQQLRLKLQQRRKLQG